MSASRAAKTRRRVSPEKARQILHDKEVHGHPLTERQRRFFGAMTRRKRGGSKKS